jgi:hypothetical protein
VNRRAREVALRVQLLVEEFTPSELADGIDLLGAAKGADLLTFLLQKASQRIDHRRVPTARPQAFAKERAFDFSELEQSDPDKYKALLAFDERFRAGTLLPTLDSCRSFGKELSKSFEPGKSRRDCLPRLLASLAAFSTERIRAAISEAASYSDREGAEPYRRLASHIISGT